MKDLIAKLIGKRGKIKESKKHMNVGTRNISGALDMSAVYGTSLAPTINSHYQR